MGKAADEIALLVYLGIKGKEQKKATYLFLMVYKYKLLKSGVRHE